MQRNQQKISAVGAIAPFLLLINAIVLEEGFVTNAKWYWLLAFTLPLLVTAIFTFYRKAS